MRFPLDGSAPSPWSAVSAPLSEGLATVNHGGELDICGKGLDGRIFRRC